MGMVADDPDRKIALKIFHNAIQNDPASLNGQSKNSRPVPFIRKVSEQEIQDNYMQVKLDVTNIVTNEMDKLRELKKKHIRPAKQNIIGDNCNERLFQR